MKDYHQSDFDLWQVSRSKDHWGIVFEEAHNPKAGLVNANLLKRSADLIMVAHTLEVEQFKKDCAQFRSVQPPALWIVYMLLAGLAIENAVKAIIIQKDLIGFRGGKYYQHDPGQLAESANIKQDAMERRLIKQLSAFVGWEGRYPAPKRKGKMTVGIPSIDLSKRLNELYGRIIDTAKANLDAEFVFAPSSVGQLAPAQRAYPAARWGNLGVGLHHVHNALRDIGEMASVVNAMIEVNACQPTRANDADAIKSAERFDAVGE
jgi:hypothetical protein